MNAQLHLYYTRPRITKNLDCRLKELFCRSLIRGTVKKLYKYHLIILKKYAFVQNLKGVAQKLSLPRPFELLALKSQKIVNFIATTSYFWKNVYFVKLYKWY